MKPTPRPSTALRLSRTVPVMTKHPIRTSSTSGSARSSQSRGDHDTGRAGLAVERLELRVGETDVRLVHRELRPAVGASPEARGHRCPGGRGSRRSRAAMHAPASLRSPFGGSCARHLHPARGRLCGALLQYVGRSIIRRVVDCDQLRVARSPGRGCWMRHRRRTASWLRAAMSTLTSGSLTGLASRRPPLHRAHARATRGNPRLPIGPGQNSGKTGWPLTFVALTIR